MKVIDWITSKMGLGVLYSIRVEGLSSNVNNMTLGAHGQEWEGKNQLDEKVTVNQLFIGLLFFRFIFDFIADD